MLGNLKKSLLLVLIVHVIAASNGTAVFDNFVEALGIANVDEVLMLRSTNLCRVKFNSLKSFYLLSSASCVLIFMMMKQTIWKIDFLRPVMLFFRLMAVTASKFRELVKSLKLIRL